VKLELRQARTADAAALAEFCASTFDDTYREFNTESDMAAYAAGAFGEELVLADIEREGCTFLIAVTPTGMLVGYVQVVLDARTRCVPGGTCAEIARLYSDRSRHGQGLGARLLEAALDHVNGAGRETVWLAVWERNVRARAFYAKHGFESVGTTTFQLGSSRQDDFVLARSSKMSADERPPA